MVHSAGSWAACSSCNEAGMSWAGTPSTKVRPATKADGPPHVVGGECSDGRSNDPSFKGATDLPSNHIPLPAADNNTCALCHANPNDYSVSVMNHVNIASNCAQCDPTSTRLNSSHSPMSKPASCLQIPIGSAAYESCHSASTFTSFV